jgi:hypothetical protein
MNNSPEIAMTVIEPGGRRWAQLLNVYWSLGDLLPLIISRLDLPDRVNYELHHVRSGRILKQGDSLSSAGIPAGEELQIKPVRNKLLTDLLDALYGEAVGYVAKQLWGQAESRLETLFRLEPDYPDPQGLRQAVATRVVPAGLAAAAASGYAGSSASAGRPQPPPGPQPSYTGQPQSSYTPGPQPPYIGAPTQPPPSPTASATAAAKPARSACGVIVILLGGLVLLGIAVVVAGYAWFMRREPEPAGVLIPTAIFDLGAGGIEEPVLGTGDVQVTLRWDNTADLDLHVTDPGGEEIYFASPTSSSSGELDVDANALCTGDPPVENVFWPTGGAPTGSYQVAVVLYGLCDATGAANYEVTIRVDGQVVDVRTGTISSVGESQFVADFSR